MCLSRGVNSTSIYNVYFNIIFSTSWDSQKSISQNKQQILYIQIKVFSLTEDLQIKSLILLNLSLGIFGSNRKNYTSELWKHFLIYYSIMNKTLTF